MVWIIECDECGSELDEEEIASISDGCERYLCEDCLEADD